MVTHNISKIVLKIKIRGLSRVSIIIKIYQEGINPETYEYNICDKEILETDKIFSRVPKSRDPGIQDPGHLFGESRTFLAET